MKEPVRLPQCPPSEQLQGDLTALRRQAGNKCYLFRMAITAEMFHSLNWLSHARTGILRVSVQLKWFALLLFSCSVYLFIFDLYLILYIIATITCVGRQKFNHDKSHVPKLQLLLFSHPDLEPLTLKSVQRKQE